MIVFEKKAREIPFYIVFCFIEQFSIVQQNIGTRE